MNVKTVVLQITLMIQQPILVPLKFPLPSAITVSLTKHCNWFDNNHIKTNRGKCH